MRIQMTNLAPSQTVEAPATAKPIVLPPNVLEHFYFGGSRLAEFRGYRPETDRGPEDWLAATVQRAGDPNSGPSRLADGTLFADVVAGDPVGWFGRSSDGPDGPADTGILVKLLDADQRLPVHVHPDRSFAGQHLHTCYGKTEAWFVLDTDGPNPAVWLGFSEDVSAADLASAVDAQDSEWMLSRMHKLAVQPGDGILVPAGTPHAIGEGVFVVEVQEPADASILLEWSVTNSGREDSHLGLGFDVAYQAVDHRGLPSDEVAALVRHVDPLGRAAGAMAALPGDADEFFEIRVLAPPAGVRVQAAEGYSVVVVLDGVGTLEGTESIEVHRGQVLAIPAAFGPWTVSGLVRLVQCLPGPPPAPTR